jgi:type III restriction enzyme
MTTAPPPFFETPILNSPYEEPNRHHALDPEGHPLNEPPREGRRRSEFITPVPKPRKKKQRADKAQRSLGLESGDGLSTDEQEYNPTPIINEIRSHLATWRMLPQSSWGVSPATARLLNHWRSHSFQGVRPFFCQIEAVETVIWLTEVAKPKRQYATIWEHILGANEQANPDLLRIAMKMTTGAGKTTVMAMLIAWQTVNAVRSHTSNAFSRGFLIIAPGITIKDRLRVLLPSDLENYYRTRELVPGDMLDDIGKAKIVITNYHAFQLREVLEVNKVGRSLLQGRHEPIVTKETEGQMVRRVAEDLMGLKNIVVINDEAHHCYREKPDNDSRFGTEQPFSPALRMTQTRRKRTLGWRPRGSRVCPFHSLATNGSKRRSHSELIRYRCSMMSLLPHFRLKSFDVGVPPTAARSPFARGAAICRCPSPTKRRS